MPNRTTRRALMFAWALIGVGVALPALLALCGASRSLETLSGWLTTPHANCALCGMTRAFVRLGRGEYDDAVGFNQASPYLFFGSLAQGLAAAICLGWRVRYPNEGGIRLTE